MIDPDLQARAYMPQAATTDWATPKALFEQLWEEFGPFDLDPCGQKEVHYSAWRIVQRGGGCFDGSTAALDGLLQDWRGSVWLNPPYGRAMPKWIEKAVREIKAGRCELVCALIPSRTDTKMWQKYIVGQVGQSMRHANNAHELIDVVRFLPGRVKFNDSKNPAPFPSAVVVWRS